MSRKTQNRFRVPNSKPGTGFGLLAVNPGFDDIADVFAPPEPRGRPASRLAWAEQQLRLAIAACAKLDVRRLATLSGAPIWPYFHPWPPPPSGLIEAEFDELARRWRPLLDLADAHDVDLCFGLDPGEDLHDGATFERFLACVGDHPRCMIQVDPSHMLQQMDYLGFIERYHARIGAFHVKDPEFLRSAVSGVYGGFQAWRDRPGRYRSLGDGQVDFPGIFSRLATFDYDGWAVLEWECCFEDREDGARDGARFIADHIIRVTEHAFDGICAAPPTPRASRGSSGSGTASRRDMFEATETHPARCATTEMRESSR